MRRAPIVIFGGTDATLAVAAAARSVGVGIAAIVTLGEAFRISYGAQEVKSARYADVGKWCAEAGVPAIPYTSYDDVFSRVDLSAVSLAIVAGWYHMVPAKVRDRFPLGAVGLHASLLPKLRGGAPLNWAILSGARETGVTMFELGDGVDDGPIYAQQKFSIAPGARIADLIARANEACAALTRTSLPAILARRLKPRPQRGEPTFGLQRQPDDSRIDWRLPAAQVERLVRASGRPYSGAFGELDGERVHIWDACQLRKGTRVQGAAGQIALIPGIDGPAVVTGKGLVVIREATDASGASVMDRLAKAGQRRFAL